MRDYKRVWALQALSGFSQLRVFPGAPFRIWIFRYKLISSNPRSQHEIFSAFPRSTMIALISWSVACSGNRTRSFERRPVWVQLDPGLAGFCCSGGSGNSMLKFIEHNGKFHANLANLCARNHQMTPTHGMFKPILKSSRPGDHDHHYRRSFTWCHRILRAAESQRSQWFQAEESPKMAKVDEDSEDYHLGNGNVWTNDFYWFLHRNSLLGCFNRATSPKWIKVISYMHFICGADHIVAISSVGSIAVQ